MQAKRRIGILHAQPEAIARFNYEVPPELETDRAQVSGEGSRTALPVGPELLVDLRNLKRESDSRVTVADETDRPQNPWRRGHWLLPPSDNADTGRRGALSSNRESAVIDSLAVLPFVNVSGDPNTEYLSDGMAESLIIGLSQLPHLKVISLSSVLRYKGREIDPQSVGRDLGVRAVLMGRLVQRGDSLSIGAELVDSRDKSHIWGEQYNRKFADVLTVQEELSREISEKLRSS